MSRHKWFLIETEVEYDEASERFEKVKQSDKGTISIKKKCCWPS